MIDTIKFKIPISAQVFEGLKKRSTESIKYRHNDDIMLVRFWNIEEKLGSYSRDINIFISESNSDYIFIEFSLPKYFFGHNIFMIYSTHVLSILNSMYFQLVKTYPDFPRPSLWEIQRIDLCYNWKLESEEKAQQILKYIQSFDYPRKKVYRYDTSIMYIGSSYTVKWYLKKPEFFKNDFRKLNSQGATERAYQYLGYAEGVLRFEVSMRKRSFKTHFGKKTIHIADLLNANLDTMIQFFFNKSMQYKSTVHTETEVIERLNHVYSSTKSARLFMYWYATNTQNDAIRAAVNLLLNPRVIRQNRSDIKNAGIGIGCPALSDFDLSIPSVNCTNPDPEQQ